MSTLWKHLHLSVDVHQLSGFLGFHPAAGDCYPGTEMYDNYIIP